MVRLRTQRTALGLYGLLLVLPTFVLGGLQWRQIGREGRLALDAVPAEAEFTAVRFRDALEARVAALLEDEGARGFEQYGDLLASAPSDDSFSLPFLVASPLVAAPRPKEILFWFAWDPGETEELFADLWFGRAPAGEAPAGRPEAREDYDALVQAVRRKFAGEETRGRVSSTRWDVPRESSATLYRVAVNRLHKRLSDCLQYLPQSASGIELTVETTPFRVQFFTEADGTPRLFAVRRVEVFGVGEEIELTDCLDRFAGDAKILQGFFLDPDWLFDELPRAVAAEVLGRAQTYLGVEEASIAVAPGEHREEILPIADLAIPHERPEHETFGRVAISVDTAGLRAASKRQRMRLLALFAMLSLSLGTGLWLLLRSVRRDLEQAQQTENLVSAVTHELRTPLSSIKLHGEMLAEGWTRDPAKQQQYYDRILRETDRLSTLVERILEKGRLSSARAKAVPCDLGALVEGAQPRLAAATPAHGRDLAFDIEADLPQVASQPEAIASILVNLIENARKYAPVDPAGGEPIRIVVRREERGPGVLLEVLDRGPGVEPGESRRVFEAFYRTGNEATRTARGTGLGLHLVAEQAAAHGGQAGVRPRSGGGACFWVRFLPWRG